MLSITIELEQHTPLIHFQHDQDDATLRASDVKPRFDTYLQKNGIDVPSYKMNIRRNGSTMVTPIKEGKRNNAPMYFGDDKKVKLIKSDSLLLTIVFKGKDIPNATILESFKSNIVSFFLTTNFGTRQTKGYGSFWVKSIEGDTSFSKYSPDVYVSYFETSQQDLLDDIELLHKTLRSGINGPSKNSLYFKSLLFSFAGEIWDKKSIKYHFLNDDTKKQVESKRSNNYDNWTSKSEYKDVFLPQKSDLNDSNNYQHWWHGPRIEKPGEYDFRDYLGFSSFETWMAYDTGEFLIKDTRPQTNYNKRLNRKEFKIEKMTVSKSFGENGRFKSPILYKPIRQEDNTYRVYIITDDESIRYLDNKIVVYKSNMPKDDSSKVPNFSLKFKPDFSLTEYLRFAFNYDVRNIFTPQKILSERDQKMFEKIVKIYCSLKNNLKKQS